MAELYQSRVDRAWSESGEDDARSSSEVPVVPAPLVPWVPSLVSPPPLPRPPAAFAEGTSTLEPLRIPSVPARERDDATLYVRPLVEVLAAPRRPRRVRTRWIAGSIVVLAIAALALVVFWPHRQLTPPTPPAPANLSPPAAPPAAPQLMIKHTAAATKSTKATPAKKKTAAKKAPPKKTAAKHTTTKKPKAKTATKAKSAGKAKTTAKPKAKSSPRKS